MSARRAIALKVLTPSLVNPYLDFVLSCDAQAEARGSTQGYLLDWPTNTWEAREKSVRRWAWAIPNEEVVRKIVALGPVVEVFAGTGYWASLVAAAGGDIVAYDKAPYANGWCDGSRHYEVTKKSARVAAKAHADRALMMCWPPYSDPSAAQALNAYKGDRFVYVGEFTGGCCASDGFFRLLEQQWDETDEVVIPQWWGSHDHAWFYKRRQR